MVRPVRQLQDIGECAVMGLHSTLVIALTMPAACIAPEKTDQAGHKGDQESSHIPAG